MAKHFFLLAFFILTSGNAFSFESYGNYSRTKPAKYSIEKRGATLEFCYNWSCSQIMDVFLDSEFLKKMSRMINACATTAEQELMAIRNAVRETEKQILRDHPFLEGDIAGNVLDEKRYGRLDCVDNSSNTNALLHILQEYHHFNFWEVDKPVGSGLFKPHWTATVKTKDKKFINKYQPQTRMGEKGYTVWTVDTWLTTFAYNPFLLEINDWLEDLDPWGTAIYSRLYHKTLRCWEKSERQKS